MKTTKILSMAWVIMGIMGGAATAVAGECEGLDVTWDEQLVRLSNLVQAKKVDEAKKLFDAMEKVCSRSPLLNYYEAQRRALIHDDEGAKTYFQRASEYTYNIAVEPALSKEIWYHRYEAEYPENTKEIYNHVKKERDDAVVSLNAVESRIQEYLIQTHDEKEFSYRAGMWSGVGVGLAGLIMVGTGAGLIAGMDKSYERVDSDSNSGPQKYQIKNSYNVSLGLIGAGVAATVVGSVLAGVYGYKLSHLDDSMVLSFQIAPNAASVSMTF